MLWPIALGTAGLVGLNWQASRELGQTAEHTKTYSPWMLALLGAASGLCIGVAWGSEIKHTCSFLSLWLGNSKERDDEEELTDASDISEYSDRRARRKRKNRKLLTSCVLLLKLRFILTHPSSLLHSESPEVSSGRFPEAGEI